ncbi:MAG TPA: hypothetical protein VJ728_14720 [Candidatus Binataceae bacterium]|nr:hypothetical protein [Candidatus Binataceae bacterium]
MDIVLDALHPVDVSGELRRALRDFFEEAVPLSVTMRSSVFTLIDDAPVIGSWARAFSTSLLNFESLGCSAVEPELTLWLPFGNDGP